MERRENPRNMFRLIEDEARRLCRMNFDPLLDDSSNNIDEWTGKVHDDENQYAAQTAYHLGAEFGAKKISKQRIWVHCLNVTPDPINSCTYEIEPSSWWWQERALVWFRSAVSNWHLLRSIKRHYFDGHVDFTLKI